MDGVNLEITEDGLEALADRVRHQEERLRHLEAPHRRKSG